MKEDSFEARGGVDYINGYLMDSADNVYKNYSKYEKRNFSFITAKTDSYCVIFENPATITYSRTVVTNISTTDITPQPFTLSSLVINSLPAQLSKRLFLYSVYMREFKKEMRAIKI
ncbi:MAG: hypothetical protein R6U96_00365 [Promethearchaeia archaeon]